MLPIVMPDVPYFPVTPYRLSGAICGALLNHAGSLAALGHAVHEPPYKAAPTGVVLYIKPRNTLLAAGEPARVDAATPELEAGVALGVVIGRTACAVAESRALEHVAGYLVVVDFSAPHGSYFRPQTRLKARDASCALGPAVVPRGDVGDADALGLRVFVDGRLAHEWNTAHQVRSVARLIADVSDFMTLAPGDVLLTGLAPGAPRVGAGAHVAAEIDGLGRIEVRVEPAESSR